MMRLLSGVCFLLVNSFIKAVTTKILYGWFVRSVILGAPDLSVFQCAGLLLVVQVPLMGLWISHSLDHERTDDDLAAFARQLAYPIGTALTCAITLLLGLCIRSCQ